MTKSAGPALKRQFARWGQQIAFIEVYVREAHPGSRFAQPSSMAEKVEHARAYQRRDQVPWTIAIDDLDGTLHRALDPKPHAVFLVDAQGVIAGRILWGNDARGLGRGLQKLAAGLHVGDIEHKAIPLTRGLGSFDEVLDLAGGYAKSDLLHQVPPMFALAKLARLFKPLPPLGRGLAAMATALGLAGLASFGVRALLTSRR